jgi:hypothetical protein
MKYGEIESVEKDNTESTHSFYINFKERNKINDFMKNSSKSVVIKNSEGKCSWADNNGSNICLFLDFDNKKVLEVEGCLFLVFLTYFSFSKILI